MKKILQHLFEYKTLSKSQAKEVLLMISEGAYNDHEITAFITAFLMRSITIEELQGFREALLELCIPVELGTHELIDIVGTGGDQKDTFNISTLSCFLVAGAGEKVAKHGNYAASSVSGSSNVMEHLGYRFTNNSFILRKQIEETNICFLHAPLFHPALKIVGTIRKNLGIRTFFNMLGPLANPANPNYQLVGVYNLEMARIYNYLLQQNGTSFTIIHSLDGYDEISLTADSKVITNKGTSIIPAMTLGKCEVSSAAIYGGDTVEKAAQIFMTILEGNGTPQQNAVVTANAAMALQCMGKHTDYESCFGMAKHSLESGKALKALQNLILLSK